MKSNLLRTFFEWALITSVLMSVGFFIWYYLQSHSMRIARGDIETANNRFQNNHKVMQMLLNESQQYAQTNADLQKVLDSLRAPVVVAPAAPVKKPATK